MKIIETPYRGLPLYTAGQVRELDRCAIEAAGVAGYTLMTRAGEACQDRLAARWPSAERLVVVCGTGNNGGDGYVVARLAREAGLQVQVLQLGDAAAMQGDARTAREAYLSASGDVAAFTEDALAAADVIVDAIFGTGLARVLEGAWRSAVESINAAGRPVLSIDVPSGLHADTGAVMGAAMCADETVTMIGRKTGLYTGGGGEHSGTVTCAGLDVPASVYASVQPRCRLLEKPALGPLAARRMRTAHKGDFGHVLIIGGAPGMAGAVRLAGEAALRCGAGRVTVATSATHAAALAASSPELMVHAVDSRKALKSLMLGATVIVAGPGLGQSPWAHELLSAVLESSLPRVLDADVLNLLAQEPVACNNCVLTPHPGEAGRLLQCSTAEVQADRFAAIAALGEKYSAVCVLKGAGTLVRNAEDELSVCAVGNPGMAAAGMGDVLSGVIAGLIAQGLPLAAAAAAGVCVHGAAGDRAAQAGERGTIARDLIGELRAVMNPDREFM